MRAAILLLFTMAFAPLAQAQTALTVENAWIMTPPPGASEAAAYVTIRSGPADRLLSVSCDCAARADLHEMSMNGAVMTMRPLRYGLATPTNASLAFGPHGAHIMLTGLTVPLREGQSVPLRLTFRDAGAVTATATVRRH